MFLSFAVLGLLMPGFWMRQRTEDPAATAARAGKIDWRHVIWSRPVLLLTGVAFAYTSMWQFYPTWFPTYLIEKRQFSLAQSSWYAGLPFLFGLAATWGGGLMTDLLAARWGTRTGRLVLGAGSLFLSACLLAAGILWPGREVAAVLIALAAGAGDLLLGVCWATAVEIGGRSAGAVSGLMNAASNTGAFIAPILIGWAVSTFHEWNQVLLLAAAANVVAAFLWMGLYSAGDGREPQAWLSKPMR
jgi:ACS family glucarate transporter-like MFS transporter